MKNKAEIGILGGTGLYELIKDPVKIKIRTPFGFPSAKVSLGKISGHKVAFIPRHGEKHQYPPHAIPYLANLWALKSLGVKRVIAPAAVGSLNLKIKPGTFVICDQFVDWTEGRPDTIYNGPKTVHVSTADPYCRELRKIAIRAAKKLKIPAREKGTVVVIQGPRFSTRAESRFFAKQGFDLINMTQYPEVILARELGLCYVNISLVTDYDAGLEGSQDFKPVSAVEFVKVFKQNISNVKKIIEQIVAQIPLKPSCRCGKYLEEGTL
ncbi:MAG: S-methyl-5'-thioadenosine phosphorylase [Patescibacteria group bacterium]